MTFTPGQSGANDFESCEDLNAAPPRISERDEDPGRRGVKLLFAIQRFRRRFAPA